MKKIILTRPAVEAGENLGFLPGDLKRKSDSIYVRYTMLYIPYTVWSYTNRLLERGVIEVLSASVYAWAYIFVHHLDRLKNTTRAQMKMFLTRLGFGSKNDCQWR